MQRHSNTLPCVAIAFALDCEYYFNDVMCILRARIKARGGRSLDAALAAVVASLGDNALADELKRRMPVALRVAIDEFHCQLCNHKI